VIVRRTILLQQLVPLEEFVNLDLAKVSDVTDPLAAKRGEIRVDSIFLLSAETTFDIADTGDGLVHESTDCGNRVSHGFSSTVVVEKKSARKQSLQSRTKLNNIV